jgi:putative RecB family exonuclease
MGKWAIGGFIYIIRSSRKKNKRTVFPTPTGPLEWNESSLPPLFQKSYTLRTVRTSYSSLETYLQCPQKFKFEALEKIRAPKSREAIFGTLVHSALKFMFSRDPLFPTIDEVIAYFRERFPAREILNQEAAADPLKRPWSEEDTEAYIEEGIRMLKRFYEKNAPWNYTVADLESRFEVVLADEKTGQQHVLAGVIDRIDKTPEGKYEIIDYKTSKRMPSQEALDKNLQLSLYSLGLQKRWPHLNAEDIKLSLYFLKHEEKLSTKASPETTEKTKNHILKVINEIQERLRQRKEFEPMPGPLCNWCPYRPMCPAWKHLYKRDEKNDKRQGIEDAIKEYLEIKKTAQEKEMRLAELQKQIKEYMAQEGLTRVFGETGVISQKTVQRYEYDFFKIKEILSPLGKWEEILKADETKLKHLMRDLPEGARFAIENSRMPSKEYSVLTASIKPVVKEIDKKNKGVDTASL